MTIKIVGTAGSFASIGRPRLQGILSDKSADTGHVNSSVAEGNTEIESPATIKVAEPPQEKKSSLKFIPYLHPTPGKTKVHIRGKGKNNDAYLTVTYDPKTIPDLSEIQRSSIKLQGISPKIVSQAKLVANAILDEWKEGHDLRAEYKSVRRAYQEELKASFKYKVKENPEVTDGRKIKIRYKSTEEKTALRTEMQRVKKKCEEHTFGRIYGKNTTTSLEVFNRVFNEKMDLLVGEDKVALDLLGDDAFKTLVAFLCLRKNKKLGFTVLPHGLLNHDDENLVRKIEILGRYLLVNKLGKDTAEKVEKFKNWTVELNKAQLQQVGKLISPVELLKILFPGCLDGGNPPIREWLVPATNKWQEGESVRTNAKRACKYVVVDQGVVNPDGTIDMDKLLEKDWAKIFYRPEYGLRGAIGICPFLGGTVEALELAVPGLIGAGEDQIPRARFKYPDKWTGESKLTLIDELTKYIVEQKLKLFDDDGIVSARKIKTVGDWHRQYDEECTGCLRRSGVLTASSALKRVYPHLFGWGLDQVHPGDIRYTGMWHGASGERLFRLKFAKSLHTVFEKLKEKKVEGFEDHGARFYPDIDPPIHLPRRDFNNLKNYYIAHGINWYDHFLAFGLTAGFMQVAKDQVRAFEMLLGKPNTKTNCFGRSEILVDDVKDRNPTRTSLISSLLADLNFIDGDKIQITGLGRNRSYGDNETGIEGTFLEPFLSHRPPSNVLEITDALYEAFAAAILPSPTKDKNEKANDRTTALEKILIARYPVGEHKGEIILSDRRLSHLLKALQDSVLDNLEIDDGIRVQLDKLISRIRKLKKPQDSPRELLLAACETDRKYGTRNNTLCLMNSILEQVFEAIAIHEIRYERLYEEHSEHYERVFGNITEAEDLEEEAVSGSEIGNETENPDQDIVTTEDINALDALLDRQAIIARARKASNSSPEEALVAIEAASEEAAEMDVAGQTGSSWEEYLDETRKICEGRLQERDEIIETLVKVSKDKTQSRKYLMPFLRLLEEGDLTIQIRMLIQIAERAKKRSPGRFDYSSLRARPLPATFISSIISVPESASENSGDNLPCLVNPDNIDTELFSCMPEWWPHKDKAPLAIPLLYWNNVLCIGIQAGDSLQLQKGINKQLEGYEVEYKTIREEHWLKLVELYKRYANIRLINPGRPPLRYFIPDREEAQIIENVAALRKAATAYSIRTEA